MCIPVVLAILMCQVPLAAASICDKCTPPLFFPCSFPVLLWPICLVFKQWHGYICIHVSSVFGKQLVGSEETLSANLVHVKPSFCVCMTVVLSEISLYSYCIVSKGLHHINGKKCTIEYVRQHFIRTDCYSQILKSVLWLIGWLVGCFFCFVLCLVAFSVLFFNWKELCTNLVFLFSLSVLCSLGFNLC